MSILDVNYRKEVIKNLITNCTKVDDEYTVYLKNIYLEIFKICDKYDIFASQDEINKLFQYVSIKLGVEDYTDYYLNFLYMPKSEIGISDQHHDDLLTKFST